MPEKAAANFRPSKKAVEVDSYLFVDYVTPREKALTSLQVGFQDALSKITTRLAEQEPVLLANSVTMANKEKAPISRQIPSF